jgi:sugar lactone lactonase YvrE
MKISPQGRVMDVIEGSPAVQLNKTFKMTAGINGTIYLTELNRSIMAIYPDGNRSTITCTSPDNDSFGQVIDVEAGDDGYLYVGEMSEGRVRKLTTDGTLVARWDGCGSERFNTPVSIVPCRDGRIYVSDTLNQRIVWFDSNKYSFGNDTTVNLAGKGVLWDSVIAGDNYTVAHQDGLYAGGTSQGTPGFSLAIALAGLFFAGAVLCSRRVRK